MEAEVLARQSGFFVSAVTTLSLAVLSIEFILNYKLSLFPFSFIIVLFLVSMFLRNVFWKKAWKKDKKALFKYSNVIIWALGIALLLVFIYFGSMQTVTYKLEGYALNPYLLVIAAIWTIYSALELYMVDSISSMTKYGKANYLAIAAIVLVDLSFLVMNRFVYILPISLILLSVSTLVSGIRLEEIY